MDRPIRRALLSVFDKHGILDLGRALAQAGVEILSSGGTARLLQENDVAVTISASRGKSKGEAPVIKSMATQKT